MSPSRPCRSPRLSLAVMVSSSPHPHACLVKGVCSVVSNRPSVSPPGVIPPPKELGVSLSNQHWEPLGGAFPFPLISRDPPPPGARNLEGPSGCRPNPRQAWPFPRPGRTPPSWGGGVFATTRDGTGGRRQPAPHACVVQSEVHFLSGSAAAQESRERRQGWQASPCGLDGTPSPEASRNLFALSLSPEACPPTSC